MAPIIDVEPEVFDAASKIFGQDVASLVTNALSALTGALQGCGAMAGSDPGGIQSATSYDRAAAVTVAGLLDMANASYKLANMLQVTGFNHGRAESASDPTDVYAEATATRHTSDPVVTRIRSEVRGFQWAAANWELGP